MHSHKSKSKYLLHNLVHCFKPLNSIILDLFSSFLKNKNLNWATYRPICIIVEKVEIEYLFRITNSHYCCGGSFVKRSFICLIELLQKSNVSAIFVMKFRQATLIKIDLNFEMSSRLISIIKVYTRQLNLEVYVKNIFWKGSCHLRYNYPFFRLSICCFQTNAQLMLRYNWYCLHKC